MGKYWGKRKARDSSEQDMAMSLKAMKRIFLRLTGFIFICILILAALELGLRIFWPQGTGPVQFAYDPLLGGIPVPHQKAKRTIPDYTYTNNSIGLRGSREYSESKSTDFRILVLGDSFTYGLGVNDDETFSCLLENMLIQNGKSVEVINAGCPGKGTDYALKFFQTRGCKWKPDLVILCFDHTDFYDNMYGYYYEINKDGTLTAKPLVDTIYTKKRFLLRSRIYNWLIVNSHTANLIKRFATAIIGRLEDSKRGIITTSRAVISYPYNGRSVRVPYDTEFTAKYMAYLKSAVKECGAEFMLFYLAERAETEAYRNGDPFAHEAKLAEIAKKYKIEFYPTVEYMAESGMLIEEIYITPPRDYHFTAKGQRLIAEYMYEPVREKLNYISIFK